MMLNFLSKVSVRSVLFGFGFSFFLYWRFQCSVRAGVETFGRQGGWRCLCFAFL